MVGGAPVCADDDLPSVVDEFEIHAAARRCGVVYFCAEGRMARLAAAEPSRMAFPIGAQPLWQPRALLDEFRQHASLRAQLNRARNKGTQVTFGETFDEDDRAQLESCLREWIDTRGLPPLHFLIETSTLSNLTDRRIVVARRDGRAVGFLVATPIPARNGWLVEQIVRGRNAPNGTAELLLHGAALRLDHEGADLMTLGLAPLARRGKPCVDRSPGWLRVLLANLRAHGRRFYNFEGLESFKAKFDGAHWECVYSICSPTTPLGDGLLAITAAFAGEPLRSFLPRAIARGIGRELRSLRNAPQEFRKSPTSRAPPCR